MKSLSTHPRPLPAAERTASIKAAGIAPMPAANLKQNEAVMHLRCQTSDLLGAILRAEITRDCFDPLISSAPVQKFAPDLSPVCTQSAPSHADERGTKVNL